MHEAANGFVKDRSVTFDVTNPHYSRHLHKDIHRGRAGSCRDAPFADIGILSDGPARADRSHTHCDNGEKSCMP